MTKVQPAFRAKSMGRVWALLAAELAGAGGDFLSAILDGSQRQLVAWPHVAWSLPAACACHDTWPVPGAPLADAAHAGQLGCKEAHEYRRARQRCQILASVHRCRNFKWLTPQMPFQGAQPLPRTRGARGELPWPKRPTVSSRTELQLQQQLRQFSLKTLHSIQWQVCWYNRYIARHRSQRGTALLAYSLSSCSGQRPQRPSTERRYRGPLRL